MHVDVRRVCAVALFLVAFGAGCSQSGPDDAPDAHDGTVGSVFGRREDEELLHLAEQTLISRCMKEQGFEFRTSALGEDEFEAHPYGNDDVEASQQRGYGLDLPAGDVLPSGDAGGNLEDPNAAYVESLSPQQREAFSRALFGPPGGKAGNVRLPSGTEIGFPLEGCLAEARNELYEDGEVLMEAVSIIENLASEVQARVVGDDEYLTALKRWQECMKQQGHDVKRPADAVRLAIDQRSSTDAAAAGQREVEIAVSDAQCSRRTELVAIGERIESRVWEDVLDENTGVLEAYRELRSPALARAKSVLES